MYNKTHKGNYRPKNPAKYKGDPRNIFYRSWWEFKLMSRLDEDPNVLLWSSEEVVIPYKSPIDGRIHRYFVDFLVKVKQGNGKPKVLLIEVKPARFTVPPVLKEGKTAKNKKYIEEVMLYGINTAKWAAAREWCKDRGYEFRIFTEKELGIK